MNVLTLHPRENLKPHQLRKSGITPIGLVEHGKETKLMQAPTPLVKDAISHAQGVGMIEVEVEGESKKRTVLIKQVDKIPHTPQILNVVLNEISKTEHITVDIPVHSVGTPHEVSKAIGILVNPASTIKLKGRHSDLPASLDIDVSALEAGGSIHAGDVALPKGVELVSSADTTLFAVQHLRTAEPESEETSSEESSEVGSEN